MTCLFKGLGYALSIAPFVLLILALLRDDWTVSKQSMLTQDANAVVHENSISMMMAPFKAELIATEADKDFFVETSYKWCDKSAALLSSNDQAKLCSLLTAVRALVLISAILGGLAILVYFTMGCRSLKKPFIVLTARTAGAMHIVQAVSALVAAFLWWFLTYTYRNALKTKLGPDFGDFTLPLARGWTYCVASGALAIITSFALFTMAKRSLQARERVATIERKRSEFELKQKEEDDRKRAEEELKIEQAV